MTEISINSEIHVNVLETRDYTSMFAHHYLSIPLDVLIYVIHMKNLHYFLPYSAPVCLNNSIVSLFCVGLGGITS